MRDCGLSCVCAPYCAISAGCVCLSACHLPFPSLLIISTRCTRYLSSLSAATSRSHRSLHAGMEESSAAHSRDAASAAATIATAAGTKRKRQEEENGSAGIAADASSSMSDTGGVKREVDSTDAAVKQEPHAQQEDAHADESDVTLAKRARADAPIKTDEPAVKREQGAEEATPAAASPASSDSEEEDDFRPSFAGLGSKPAASASSSSAAAAAGSSSGATASSAASSRGAAAGAGEDIGARLLRLAGYSGEGGLGKHGTGIVEPVKSSTQMGVEGIGFDMPVKK